MDQKRMLWIVAAVGIFLLVVIGAALILYAPGKNSDPVMASIRENQTRAQAVPPPQTRSAANNPQQTQSSNDTARTQYQQIPSSVQDLTVVSGNTTIYSDRTTYAGNTPQSASGSYSGQTAPQQAVPQSGGSSSAGANVGVNAGMNSGTGSSAFPSTVTVQVNPVRIETVPAPGSSAAGSNVTYNNSAVYGTAAASVQSSGVAPVNKAPVSTAAKEGSSAGAAPAAPAAHKADSQKAPGKTAPSAPAPVKTAAKTPAAPEKTAAPAAVKKPAAPSPSYWVQAASFSSKKNAEEARAVLSAEKIPAEIFTYTDVKNTTYYRVRVGPYLTKDEAEYWKTRISIIDQFSGSSSYITNSAQPAQKK